MSATGKLDDGPMAARVEVIGNAKLAGAARVVVRALNPTRDYLTAVMTALRGRLRPGTPVVICSPDKSIELLDAAAMEQHGWVRAGRATGETPVGK